MLTRYWGEWICVILRNVCARAKEMIQCGNLENDEVNGTEFLTVTEAARMLGCCTKTLRKRIHAGELRGIRTKPRTGDWRIRRADLLEDLVGDEQPKQGPA